MLPTVSDFPYECCGNMFGLVLKKPTLPKEELNSYRPISNLSFISKNT
jgi:hypothetical protein